MAILSLRSAPLLALVACASPKTAFECTGNASCRQGGMTGLCEETSYCSFADATCPGGQRYGDAAGDGLGGTCVDYGPDPLGLWSRTSAVPDPRYTHATAVSGDHVYVIGGIAGPTAKNDVWRGQVDTTPIGPDKAITAWTLTTPLPELRRNMGAAVFGTSLFVIGGRVELNPSDQGVLVSQIANDGTVGPWQPARGLPDGLRGHTVVQTDRYVYVVGGRQPGADSARVLVATMTDGALDEWRLAGTLSETRFNTGAVAIDGFLFVFGGCVTGSGSGAQCPAMRATVEVAAIQPDGTLGPFTTTTPLPEPRWHHTAAGAKHHVYVIAGDTMSTPDTTVVWSAHVNADGSLGSWRTSSPLLAGARKATSAVVGDLLLLLSQDAQAAQLQ